MVTEAKEETRGMESVLGNLGYHLSLTTRIKLNESPPHSGSQFPLLQNENSGLDLAIYMKTPTEMGKGMKMS